MVSLLVNIFIKDKENITLPGVRAGYAKITGIVGIFLNFVLFSAKGIIGLISGSVSILADAFNNLFDAGSSIVTMVGFIIAGQDADTEHPYGHGRSEYISGLVVSLVIILVGVELIKTSIEKILHPQEVIFNRYVAIILIFSVIVKSYMYYYNKKISKKLDAPAMMATAKDSLNDVIATTVVLICAVISHYSEIRADGICGVLVGIYIIKGAIDIFKDTSDLILGHGTDLNLRNKIDEIVKEYPEILGFHDLMVHDYGPGRRVISLHAEVDSEGDILSLHDTIDNLERRLQKDLSSQAVIHMDPIVTNDEETNTLREKVVEFASNLENGISVHDFRVVKGKTHTNLIFDVVLPFESKYSPEDIKALFGKAVNDSNHNYYVVLTVDRPI